jgi:hypothetical protein
MAWTAFQAGDQVQTRRLARQAIGYRPASIFDRGLLQLVLGSGPAFEDHRP